MMKAFIIFGIIVCLIVTALFIIVNNKTKPGGNGTLSLPKLKTPSWSTFKKVFWILVSLCVIYTIFASYKNLFPAVEEEVHFARARVSLKTGIFGWTIPPIPREFENKIVFEAPLGVHFPKGSEPVIEFPGAKLVQYNERSGFRAGNWIWRQLGLEVTDSKTEFEGEVRGGQLIGLPPNIVVIRKGSELVFPDDDRGEHILYIVSGEITLGNIPHPRYTYRLKELKEVK